MKKLVSAVCAAGLLTVSANSLAAGNKIGFGFDHGFGVAGQFNNVNAFLGNDGVGFDYLFKQGNFGKDVPFNWYVGAGAYYNWNGWDEIGARVPLGVTLPFAKQWDFFAQLSPGIEFNTDNDYGGDNVEFVLGGAIGVRYAF